MSEIKEKLDVSERGKFRKLEATIAEGISSFVSVGEALKEIRDAKLYRESYKTFEKYVDDKWGMQKSQAYRLIDASVVSQNLSHNVGEKSRASEITNPRQLCELKDVPAESMESVIDKAAEIAGDDKITASDLKQARQEILEQAEPEEELVYEDVEEEEPKKQDKTSVKEFLKLWKMFDAVGQKAIWLWLVDNYEGTEHPSSCK